MIIKGIVKGEYQGHEYAKVFCVEPFVNPAGRGENCVVSKLAVQEYDRIKDEFDLYYNQEVYLIYNRFGRVDRIELAG